MTDFFIPDSVSIRSALTLSSLNYREREILKLLNGIGEDYERTETPKTIEEIARNWSIEPDRVQRLAQAAIRKIKTRFDFPSKLKFDDLRITFIEALDTELSYRERLVFMRLNGIDEKGDKTLDPQSVEEVANAMQLSEKAVGEYSISAMKKLAKLKKPEEPYLG